MDEQYFDEFEFAMAEEQSEKGDDFCMKIDEDLDFALALSLQSDFENLIKENCSQPTTSSGAKVNNYHAQKKSKTPASIVDQEWEVLDPVPDIHSLFIQFNAEFFGGTLEGVEVRWSPRMTLCAGVCCYEGRGGLCSVRLSQPLLKYRPRRDLVETLLHEMIHAYLFVTHNNKDHNAHGPEFLKHMNRINQETGTRISVYHSFHDEVDLHRQHWWKCNGPCQKRSPFFGILKRATNRAPCSRDPWWADHQAKCGGTYVKFKEPENYGQKKAQKRKTVSDTTNNGKSEASDIRSFFSNTSPVSNIKEKGNHNQDIHKPGSSNVHTLSSSFHKEQQECENSNAGQATKENGVSNIYTISLPKKVKQVTPFSGKGHTLGTSVTGNSSRLLNLNQNKKFTSKVEKGFLSPTAPKQLNFTPQAKDRKLSSTVTGALKKNHSKIAGFNNKGHKRAESHGIKGGTATRTSSSSGSKTVVLTKRSKTETQHTVQSDTVNKNIFFTGSGHVVGGCSSSENSMNSSVKELPSVSKDSKHSSQKPPNTFFPRTSYSDCNIANSERKTKHKRRVVIFSDSDEDVDNFINENLVNEKGTQKKEEKKTTLPILCDANVNNSDPVDSDFVKCPVCGSQVRSSEINNHLDNCL